MDERDLIPPKEKPPQQPRKRQGNATILFKVAKSMGMVVNLLPNVPGHLLPNNTNQPNNNNGLDELVTNDPNEIAPNEPIINIPGRTRTKASTNLPRINNAPNQPVINDPGEDVPNRRRTNALLPTRPGNNNELILDRPQVDPTELVINSSKENAPSILGEDFLSDLGNYNFEDDDKLLDLVEYEEEIIVSSGSDAISLTNWRDTRPKSLMASGMGKAIQGWLANCPTKVSYLKQSGLFNIAWESAKQLLECIDNALKALPELQKEDKTGKAKDTDILLTKWKQAVETYMREAKLVRLEETNFEAGSEKALKLAKQDFSDSLQKDLSEYMEKIRVAEEAFWKAIKKKDLLAANIAFDKFMRAANLGYKYTQQKFLGNLMQSIGERYGIDGDQLNLPYDYEDMIKDFESHVGDGKDKKMCVAMIQLSEQALSETPKKSGEGIDKEKLQAYQLGLEKLRVGYEKVAKAVKTRIVQAKETVKFILGCKDLPMKEALKQLRNAGKTIYILEHGAIAALSAHRDKNGELNKFAKEMGLTETDRAKILGPLMNLALNYNKTLLSFLNEAEKMMTLILLQLIQDNEDNEEALVLLNDLESKVFRFTA